MVTPSPLSGSLRSFYIVLLLELLRGSQAPRRAVCGTRGSLRTMHGGGHNPDNHDGVITHLEPNILECEVKWALESITMNKASGGDGIPVELFHILKNDAVKVLHSVCQPICLASQRHPGKFPKVPGRRRGKRGFPAAPRERPCESFFNASRGPSPLP